MRLLLTLTAAALLAAPAASATWYVHGTAEPDTFEDATQGLMYGDPDRSPSARKVYFNAWADIDLAGVNPNVGALGSGIYTAPALRFNAMLGIWKDCNGDGFVGMADGNLWEYRRELLLGPSICDQTSHIVGNWVWEFHWIGPGDGVGDSRYDSAEEYIGYFGPQNLVNDTSARVWHDWGLPGEKPRGSCAVAPPPGTTGSTGGVIHYVDCFSGKRAQQTVNGLDPDDRMGLRIDGQPQRSDSALNQQLPHLWYDPYHPESTGLYERDSGDPAFQTWDCDDTTNHHLSDDVVVRDESGALPRYLEAEGYRLLEVKEEDGTMLTINERNVNYTSPAPAVRNPTGSYYDGLNHTWDGTADHCGDDAGFVYASAEGTAAGVDPDLKGRNEHDTAFNFWPIQASLINWDALGGCTGTYLDQPFPPGCELYPTDQLFTPDMPDDFGLMAGRSTLGIGWYATKRWTTDPQVVDRQTLQPRGPIHATFYASVGARTLGEAQVPSTVRFYGSEWCGTNRADTINGFDCNPDNWWDPIRHPGTSPMPTDDGYFVSTQCTTGRETPVPNCREIGVKAGHPYHLRDIDCWDGRIATGVPAYASLVQLSGQGTCALPPS